MGGSFARTGMPAAVTNASYNADNQQTSFGASSLSYDANGNLISDGANTYTWNARNELSAISGQVSASFAYDAFGRRTSKTINGAGTSYLYDGVNPVEELSGGGVSAALLTGGVDEYFQRTDSSGAFDYLTDALGSTVALAGPAGALGAQYTYEPFGKTTVTGTSSSNSFQFTGRENDSDGLYFYRARYYSPTLQRFISEDPTGFRGGPDIYALVLNMPTSFTDPFGVGPDPNLPPPFPSPQAYVGQIVSDQYASYISCHNKELGQLLPGNVVANCYEEGMQEISEAPPPTSKKPPRRQPTGIAAAGSAVGESWIEAAEDCLRMFPLAALDSRFNDIPASWAIPKSGWEAFVEFFLDAESKAR